MGVRNRVPKGLKFDAGAVEVERALVGATADEPDAETEAKSLSVAASTSVSTSASTAQAAPIVMACGRWGRRSTCTDDHLRLLDAFTLSNRPDHPSVNRLAADSQSVASSPHRCRAELAQSTLLDLPYPLAA
jgi:hypothetical protein